MPHVVKYYFGAYIRSLCYLRDLGSVFPVHSGVTVAFGGKQRVKSKRSKIS